MKSKIKAVLRRLVMWAVGDYLAEVLSQHRAATHVARDYLSDGNDEHWRMLDAKISALQAIDVSFGKDSGKIVILARVRGQDIVKIFDIAPNIEMRAYKEMVEELQARYGARPEFIDAQDGWSATMRDMRRTSVAATQRAVARDRKFL